MNARDELAQVIESGYGDDLTDCPYDHAPTIADIVLAAGYSKPRTITTAEELDALPVESVVRDCEGYVVERAVGRWYGTGMGFDLRLDEIKLPATVLHEGGAA